NAWQEVANNPQGLTERNLLLQKSSALTNSAQSMEKGITDTLNQINTGIINSVSQINALASRIAQLNGQIAQIEGGSGVSSANDLRDQRDQALKDLNNLVETSSWEDADTGAITVTVGMRNLVNGSTTNTLSAVYTQSGSYTLNLDGMDVTARISKGELGGRLEAGQDIRANLLDLRLLVASITNRVNLQHAQGVGLDTSTGLNFFNPIQLSSTDNSAGATMTSASITNYSQLTLEEYSVQFATVLGVQNYRIYDAATGVLKTSGVYTSGANIDIKDQANNPEGIRIVITGVVTDQDSFTVSPLTSAIQNFGTAITDPRKIGASASANTLPGDNTNALALADILNSKFAELNTGTFADYYQSLVGQVGSSSKTASDGLTFSNNFLTQLNNKRDSVSGVNMDEEASNLVRYQRAYQAASRLITTADTLFQELLSLLK
ncbi:MAG: hypothetical protein C0407_11305, partial [Desulfobacca sp.]|nr:hypothetical protein [Desulfobacca sp.]